MFNNFGQREQKQNVTVGTPWALNPTAHLFGFIEQCYAYSEVGVYETDLGPKSRHAAASGTSARWSESKAGPGALLSGSTGYLAATGHQLGSWSHEVLFVKGATTHSTLVTIAELPGSSTRDRSLYVNATGKLTGYMFDGASEQEIAGTTTLASGEVYHGVVTVGQSSTIKVYLNGAREGSKAVGGSGYFGYTTPEFVAGYGGGGSGGSSTLTGGGNVILYAALYNKELSADDVRYRFYNQFELFLPYDYGYECDWVGVSAVTTVVPWPLLVPRRAL